MGFALDDIGAASDAGGSEDVCGIHSGESSTHFSRSHWISHLNKPSLESRQREPKLVKIRPSFLQRSAGVSVPSSLVRVVPTSCDSHQSSLGRPVMLATLKSCLGLTVMRSDSRQPVLVAISF
ncbi:hypothetical protein F0562_032962 [Nyssa sinensis]|uniref:Uncharacterized protein n=1 Tax=Nyssa sinensis TaxID=561372 RepID=A0A5J5AV96_9ASTE|nr:hypothetical protein F0562_032962 [Nyssa sinensis]